MSVPTRYAHLLPDHLESALRLSPLAQQKLTALDQNKRNLTNRNGMMIKSKAVLCCRLVSHTKATSDNTVAGSKRS